MLDTGRSPQSLSSSPLPLCSLTPPNLDICRRLHGAGGPPRQPALAVLNSMGECRKRLQSSDVCNSSDWHCTAPGAQMACHRKRVAGLRTPELMLMYALASRRHLSVAPAGNPSAGYGGRCVGAFGPAGLTSTRCSNHVPSATFMSGGCRLPCTEPCHERIGLPASARLPQRRH